MRGEKYECSFLPDRIEISNFYIEFEETFNRSNKNFVVSIKNKIRALFIPWLILILIPQTVSVWIQDNDALSLNKNQSEGREGSLTDLLKPSMA